MRKRSLILMLLLFTVSCTHVAEKPSSRPAVQIPEKEREAAEELMQEPDREKKQEDKSTKALAEELDQRLQQILEEADVQGEAEIYAPEEDRAGDAQEVSFNFYDADLVEVIRVFMELLEEDYILHPDVQGKVSLSVDGRFYPEQILDLLQGVLRVNNMAMIRKDESWEILPQAKVSKQLDAQELILPDADKQPKRGQVIQGFSLRFIPAKEMVNIIEPYLSKGAQVYAHESKGVLLVSDYPHTLEKVAELVRQFDESVFGDIQARVFGLRFVQAEEAAEQLEGIAQNFGLGPDKSAPAKRISFLPLDRLNMVLAVTKDEQVLDFVQTWVDGLDQEQPQEMQTTDQQEIFVYYVQHGDAEEIVSSLRGVFESGARQDGEEASGQGQQDAQDQEEDQEEEQEGEGEPGTGAGQVSGELSGEVRFNVDKTTNAIITRCNSRDYSKVESVIQKLDLYPKQVLIEVVIAEVTLKDTTELGVDWEYILSLGDGLEGEIVANRGGSSPGAGASLLLESSNRLEAALDAAVEDNELQILSTPTLLAADNKEARINIGDEVPFPTSTKRKSDDTDSSEVVDTTIQYRDTGIILDVLPKINKDGMVRLEIVQEVSNLSQERVEGIDAPVINTRHTSTNLAVQDQQTVVIAGLMEQQRDKSSSGVPGFQRLPGVKHLFGHTKDSYENTELLVFITPHVILSQEDSNVLTRNFLNRLDEVKQEMD